MSSAATRRIQKELAELMAQPLEGVTIVPDENNIQSWEVIIRGPSQTAYANGKFRLAIEFSHEFPFKAPTMKFKTKIYHPNIDSEGNLCMGILKVDQWKPSTKMNSILLAIYDLIENPNPDDPLVTAVADQYRTDRKSFDRKAAEFTRQYAQ